MFFATDPFFASPTAPAAPVVTGGGALVFIPPPVAPGVSSGAVAPSSSGCGGGCGGCGGCGGPSAAAPVGVLGAAGINAPVPSNPAGTTVYAGGPQNGLGWPAGGGLTPDAAFNLTAPKSADPLIAGGSGSGTVQASIAGTSPALSGGALLALALIAALFVL